METRTGVASIVSSCERLAAEADGRILLGTGSNRASCFWGCHCRGRGRRTSGLGWSSARLIRVSQAEGERKETKNKKETRDKRGLGRFLFLGCTSTARTWTSTCACLLLHLVVTGWRCRQCDWRLEGVHDQSPGQCVTVLLYRVW